jgi:hypothetical protein
VADEQGQDRQDHGCPQSVRGRRRDQSPQGQPGTSRIDRPGTHGITIERGPWKRAGAVLDERLPGRGLGRLVKTQSGGVRRAPDL